MSTKKAKIRICGYISSEHIEVRDWVRSQTGAVGGGADKTGKILKFTCAPARRLTSDDLRSLADLLDKLDSIDEEDSAND